MAIRYEYWRHVLTGDIYAVKLDDARVIGACLMDRHEAHEELLPLLLYLDKHVADVERDRPLEGEYCPRRFAWQRRVGARLPDVAQRRSP